jgi:hypothetical protein
VKVDRQGGDERLRRSGATKPNLLISWISEVSGLADILIRGLSEVTVAEIDRRAGEQGLSRAEYLRRRLDAEYRSEAPVALTDADWGRLGRVSADLNDPEVMGGAWS